MPKPVSRAERVARRRAKLRAAGLRPVQILVLDTRAGLCRRVPPAIPAEDAAELTVWLEKGAAWPGRLPTDKLSVAALKNPPPSMSLRGYFPAGKDGSVGA